MDCCAFSEPRGRDSLAENIQSPATVGAIPHSTAEQHSPGNNRRKQQQAGPLQVREQKDEIDFSQHQSNSIQDEAFPDEAWSVLLLVLQRQPRSMKNNVNAVATTKLLNKRMGLLPLA